MTREKVRDLFDKQRGEIVKALPQHVDADTFIRIFLTAINKTPKLLECSQPSLMQAAMDLAQLGLVADSVMGLAYLLPFNDSKRGMICQLIVGYAGFIELAYRAPKVKAIRWNVVHAKDRFDYVDGLDPRLHHVPSDDEDPGPLSKAYAICELEGGGKTWAVLNRREIMKAKGSSRSANSDYSPWNTWEDQMWAKTAVKAMLKRVPKSRELDQAYMKDADDAVIDVAASAITPTLAIPTREEAAEVDPSEPAETQSPSESSPPKTAPKTKKAEAKPTPAPDLFVESDDHKKFRAGLAEAGIPEAQALDYLRTEGLVDESVNDIKMIPQKRVTTLLVSLDGMIEQINAAK